MTLRERIESYVESLGGEMDGFELTQDGLRAILDAILTETCVEDAERDRLARIGELVEGLAVNGRTVGAAEHLDSFGAYRYEAFTRTPEGNRFTHGATLLDALQSLKERCG